MQNDKGLLGSLFDLSFSSFITTRLVKVLFALAIVASAIGALVIAVSGFSQGFFAGLGTLLMAVLMFFIYVIAVRVWLELIIVIFRIAENVSLIASSKTGGVTPPPAPTEPGL